MPETGLITPGPLPRTESFHFTAEGIKAFAEQYDPQPMHLDEEMAEKGPFGTLVASGWQALTITMRLFVQSRPFGDVPYVGAGIENIRFHHPLLPGTDIHVEPIVSESRLSSMGNRQKLKLSVETKDSKNDTVIVSQDWNILVYDSY